MYNKNIENFPPNIDPQTYSFIAVLVGSALVGDYSAAEQNSIANWLILVGQFLLTTASQQALIESRLENNNININTREAKNGGSYFSEGYKSNQNQRGEVDFLLDAVNNLYKELEKLKKN